MIDDDFDEVHKDLHSVRIEDGELKIISYKVNSQGSTEPKPVKEVPLENIDVAEIAGVESTVAMITEEKDGVECPHPDCDAILDTVVEKEKHMKFQHTEDYDMR